MTCMTVPSGMLTTTEHVVFAQVRRLKPAPPVPDTRTESPILNLLTLTVKYTTADAALDPAEFEADTSHMYVAPFCSVGQTTEVVVTFCASTLPPPTFDTATE
jgi:hypothetical protein